MRLFALSSARKILMAGAAFVSLSLVSMPSHAQPDPPAQAGRLSYITGTVSFQPVGSDDWGEAFPNLPLGPGDRIVTDFDGQAEIQVGQTFIRIGPNADVSLVDSTPGGLFFGVAQGSVHVRTFGLWQGQSVVVNTPSGSVTESQPGEFRVDVMLDEQAALFTAFGDETTLFISGAGGFEQYITGQALELVGSNPVFPQWMQPADWDALDQWSRQRDQQIAQALSYRYVSPEVPGAYELDAAGSWMPGTPYGPIWFPNSVPYGWAPYHYGHWVNHAPWGWVWVEDESWGYAPFHYGRWVSFNGRWGWVPGPPAAHPVWSPALVVFAGGINVGGVGVSAWFPLGPGEPYRPWYPCSPHYIDVVNITNIVEAPRVHVQTTYVNINVVNVVYVNRTIAVTAMRQEDFAAGRPARQASVVVDVHQMDRVQVVTAPQVRPSPAALIGHPPARPIKVSVARPVLINASGKAFAAKPGAPPMEPPVKPAPPVRALAGHTVIAPPPNAGKPPARTPYKPAPAAEVKPVPVSRPAAPAAPPAAKPTPPPANKPAPPERPVEPKPAVKQAPAPEAKTPPPPAAKTPAQPAEKMPVPEAKKPVEPAAPPAAKPGTPPPAKTDKNKKDEKEKDKEDKKPE
jgi:hypothetical protein